MVRAGAVVLLCGGCRGEPPQRRAPAPPADEEDDDYDAIVIAAEPADETDDYDDLSISPGEVEPGRSERNVVYSDNSPAVSGDIDTGEPDSR